MSHDTDSGRLLLRCTSPDQHAAAAPLALLCNADVMADVLGFLERSALALQLASVNSAFAGLCSCWCQRKGEAEKADYEDDAEAVDTMVAAIENNNSHQLHQQLKCYRECVGGPSTTTPLSHCWSCTSIRCVHLVRYLWAKRCTPYLQPLGARSEEQLEPPTLGQSDGCGKSLGTILIKTILKLFSV